ncbi:MAG: hypothetical protein LBH66_02890 [Oscillospiraceae bacterium]|jgi:cell division septum initiation protein DivIVA|nr:hypothetical protein [Oscillospiraceae bacterium]
METEVYNLLNELEGMLENCRKVPFATSYMIDRDAAIEIVSAIRDAMPVELRDALNLVRQEHRIIQNAQMQADSKVADADSQARMMLQVAQDKADQLVSDAESRAKERESRAAEQANRTLEAAERKAEERTNQTAILKRAEMQANELIQKAQGDAQRVYLMNLDHCEDLLKRVEDKAIEIADILRQSRNELAEGR